MDEKNEPPPPGRDPRGTQNTIVVAHYPKPDANAQKGFAAIGGITIHYEDDTPDHIKKAAQHHFHMIIAWCKLRPHVQKQKVVNLHRKGKRRAKSYNSKRRRRW